MRYKVVAEIPRYSANWCEYKFETLDNARKCALWIERTYGVVVTVFENKNWNK